MKIARKTYMPVHNVTRLENYNRPTFKSDNLNVKLNPCFTEIFRNEPSRQIIDKSDTFDSLRPRELDTIQTRIDRKIFKL